MTAEPRAPDTGAELSAPARASRRTRALATLGGAMAAFMGIGLAWGFTVDDALISTRVAHHLALGLGYRFNADGPIVDCVTPLGWAGLLSPIAAGGAWRTLELSSLLGSSLWIASAAWLCRRCAEAAPGWHWLIAASTLAASLPMGAWASSGMETPLVMALGCAALIPGFRGALAAGVAAALRPELLPWAIALTLGSELSRDSRLPERMLCAVLVSAPALIVAIVREVTFGHPAPLAVFAKPSDVEHGLRYAFGALALSGPPWLLASRGVWRKLARHEVAIAVAALIHLVVLVGVGGDWMPFWRLALPVLPGLLLLGVSIARHGGRWPNALRLGAVLACAALLHLARGPEARGVKSQRRAMIERLPELLAGARRVATLDVGWVGASGSQHVIDLAGVTDPEVAYRPGGHTTKRLPDDFLERRTVDALVLLLPPQPPSAPDASPAANSGTVPLRFARGVENRIMRLRGSEEFELSGEIPLTPHQRYVVLRRRQAPEVR